MLIKLSGGDKGQSKSYRAETNTLTVLINGSLEDMKLEGLAKQIIEKKRKQSSKNTRSQNVTVSISSLSSSGTVN